MEPKRRYFVGVDVGLNSVGFAAIEIEPSKPDDSRSGGSRKPISLLNSMVLIHDSGVDPEQAKVASTRKATSGLARRARWLLRTRRNRLRKLDQLLVEMGLPLVDLSDREDVFLPWRDRATLASRFIEDARNRDEMLSIAVRHMARHRGWRNPYSRVESLLIPEEPSDFYLEFKARVEVNLGRKLPAGATPAQIVLASGLTTKLRGEGGLLGGKLHQSDNANELRAIAEMQRLPSDQLGSLIRAVFAAKSPRGSAAKNVGHDVLPGQESLPRASKASPAFQIYRMVTVVANLRVRETDGVLRALSTSERERVVEYLASLAPKDDPTWSDVAEELGLRRAQLTGTATLNADGERPSARPPLNITDRIIRSSKQRKLIAWWQDASAQAREVMVEALSNAGAVESESDVDDEIGQLLASLSDDELVKLDNLEFPSGRAAYSVDSLQRLTKQMLSEPIDLHQARKNEFKISDVWTPPADPIGVPIGNPAVDRVLKAVARWLKSAEDAWGTPESVVIEHVRAGLMSERAARELDKENNARFRAREAARTTLIEDLNLNERPQRSDLARFFAVTRQNSQCAYCGGLITYQSAEMDHIVPRAGEGSTNTRANLLAVCKPCNGSKSKTRFSDWATRCEIEEVSLAKAIERVKQWPAKQSGMSVKELARLKQDVIARLRQTEDDPPIDARSIESVAWMATELRRRISDNYARQNATVEVSVYRGALTAEARKASGIEKRLHLIGGPGKTRLDRRHHAIDAAVVAMLRPAVAKTLSERSSIRDAQQRTRAAETWKNYPGDSAAERVIYAQWILDMKALSTLLDGALKDDRVPVTQNIRLRLGNGLAHQQIEKLERSRVGDALSNVRIDRAESPALWCALTRHPDFDAREGLPFDMTRVISVQGRRLAPTDEIGFFGSSSAALLVRGGAAPIGNGIHHARIYSIEGGKRTIFAMLRVFAADLLRHRTEDLFEVELPPQSISRRVADPKLRAALDNGTARYRGWVVKGDEVLLSSTKVMTGMAATLNAEYPEVLRWRVSGYESSTILNLRPVLLSSEGVPTDASDAIHQIFKKGWRPSVNKLVSEGQPTIIRRDALGRPRLRSNAHLPVCWKIGAQGDG